MATEFQNKNQTSVKYRGGSTLIEQLLWGKRCQKTYAGFELEMSIRSSAISTNIPSSTCFTSLAGIGGSPLLINISFSVWGQISCVIAIDAGNLVIKFRDM